jgi:HSP20 family protein
MANTEERNRDIGLARGREQEVSREASPRRYGGSPFNLMRRMFDDMDRIFGGLSPLGSPLSSVLPRPVRTDDAWFPDIEVRQDNDEIVVRADLPGTAENDVHVSIEDDVLTISGERRSEQRETRGDVLVSERTYGRFRRQIQLPPGVDPETAAARFETGVLEIRLRAPQQRRGREVKITTGKGQGPTPIQQASKSESRTEQQPTKNEPRTEQGPGGPGSERSGASAH